MVLDGVVLASLLTIATLLAILVYLVYYGYRHLREDEEKAAATKEENPGQGQPD
jgi:high-affinity Fe2+/Pb2+ permease